jgi:oligoribonuclease (3'-5' exoribonuclease)
MMQWKNYILSLFITLAIFGTAVLFSRYITNQKLSSLKETQDSIALDIMSSETQFSLLSELSCREVGQNTLSQELNSIAEKVEYSEKNINNKEEVLRLKKYYTLLQIKDFLLVRKITERCNKPMTSIIYIYTTADNCSECTRQGYVLTTLRQKYPNLRVYSFDYNVDVSALKALVGLYKIEDTKLPAIIINDEKIYTGFQSLEDIEKQIPDVVKAAEAEAEAKAKGIKIDAIKDVNPYLNA